VILSDDILSIPAEKIVGTNVDATVVGGRVLYRRPGH